MKDATTRHDEGEVVITPYRDGPYLVRGPFALRDADGEPIPVARRTIALCRCGKSRTRPFCDGTHKLIDFRAPGALETWPPEVPAAEEAASEEAASEVSS